MNADVLLALTLQVFLFQAPGILEIAHKRLGQEVIQALIVAAGRRIVWRRYMDMVTTHVLHLEAGVGHSGQQQPTHPVFHLRILVDQLVTQVDGNDATHGTDGHDPADLAEQAVIIGHENVAGVEQHRDPHKAHGDGGHPIEDFLAHGRHLNFLVRVARVLTHQEIQDRNNPEDEDIHEPRPVVLCAALYTHKGRKRHQRHHQGPESQVTVFFHF